MMRCGSGCDRAALVSANGKHKLPRSDFRDAALRYGATPFCTSRRSREIVSGSTSEPCCQIQYACNSQAPVSLSVSANSIEADDVACARGNLSGVLPIIEVRQHVVEPSPILTTIAETEIRKHMDWAVGWLCNTLNERRARPADADLTPISLKVYPRQRSRRGAAATRQRCRMGCCGPRLPVSSYPGSRSSRRRDLGLHEQRKNETPPCEAKPSSLTRELHIGSSRNAQ